MKIETSLNMNWKSDKPVKHDSGKDPFEISTMLTIPGIVQAQALKTQTANYKKFNER